MIEKVKVNISHLVVNGCSFTYCQGLTKPQEEGWPALLAKKLNVPVVNLAIPGSGNDGICRRNYEYFFLNKPKNNFPFFINAWSFSARREEFYIEYNNEQTNDYVPLDFEGTTTLEKEIVYNMSTDLGMQFAERRKLLYWLSSIQLFQNNKIPYIMTDYFPSSHLEIDKVESNYPYLYEAVHNDPYKVENFCNFGVIEDRLPCGHWGPLTMIKLVDYIFSQITNLYDLNFVEADEGYIDLQDYKTDIPKQHAKNLWLKK